MARSKTTKIAPKKTRDPKKKTDEEEETIGASRKSLNTVAEFEEEANRLENINKIKLSAGKKVSPNYGVGGGFLDQLAMKYLTPKQKAAYMQGDKAVESYLKEVNDNEPEFKGQEALTYDKMSTRGAKKLQVKDPKLIALKKKAISTNIVNRAKGIKPQRTVTLAPPKQTEPEKPRPFKGIKQDTSYTSHALRKELRKRQGLGHRIGGSAMTTARQNVHKATGKRGIEFLGEEEYIDLADTNKGYASDDAGTDKESSPKKKKRKKQKTQQNNVQHPLLNTEIPLGPKTNLIDFSSGRTGLAKPTHFYANKYPTGYT